MADLFQCSLESCGFRAPADRMWNLDRKDTGGKLVILCGREAADARKRKLHAYRLSDTIRRDAERAAKRAHERTEREEFFARFGRTRLKDAFAKATPKDTAPPAHVADSSRQEIKVE